VSPRLSEAVTATFSAQLDHSVATQKLGAAPTVTESKRKAV